MVLVDTSVWIDYLKAGGVRGFTEILLQDEVALSFWVRLELLSGTRQRKERVSLERSLRGVQPLPREVSKDEILGFFTDHSLGGLGLSAIDITLLAEAFHNRLPLWTADKALGQAARALGMAYDRP